jgi:hypothetical protein
MSRLFLYLIYRIYLKIRKFVDCNALLPEIRGIEGMSFEVNRRGYGQYNAGNNAFKIQGDRNVGAGNNGITNTASGFPGNKVNFDSNSGFPGVNFSGGIPGADQQLGPDGKPISTDGQQLGPDGQPLDSNDPMAKLQEMFQQFMQMFMQMMQGQKGGADKAGGAGGPEAGGGGCPEAPGGAGGPEAPGGETGGPEQAGKVDQLMQRFSDWLDKVSGKNAAEDVGEGENPEGVTEGDSVGSTEEAENASQEVAPDQQVTGTESTNTEQTVTEADKKGQADKVQADRGSDKPVVGNDKDKNIAKDKAKPKKTEDREPPKKAEKKEPPKHEDKKPEKREEKK